MTKTINRPLQAFLCHTSADKPAVRVLYKRLIADGVDAWLDEEKLLPGQNWRLEIPNAVRDADVVIICLSNHAITKEGYVQKEISFALDIAQEKPEGVIYIVPVKLEACEIPARLSDFQCVNLSFDGKRFDELAYNRLLSSLRYRAIGIGLLPINTNKKTANKFSLQALLSNYLKRHSGLIYGTRA